MNDSKNLPAVDLRTTDLSDTEIVNVTKFVEDGLPGIATLGEDKFVKMTELYLSGSTYRQISMILSVPKVMVHYISHHYGWFAAKREYLTELQERMKYRVMDSKLASQDFMLLLVQAYQKKIGHSIKQYLETDDASHTNAINVKEVAQLLKTIEMVQSLNNEGKDSKGKTPAVGLNLGDGVTIERSGDNKVTITPKERVVGDMLKKFADKRRAEQNKPDETSDITEETTNTQGANDEEE